MTTDSIKQITEDLLLTISRLRLGELEINGPGDDGVTGVEVLVNVAERLCETVGLENLWVPEALADVVDMVYVYGRQATLESERRAQRGGA